MRLRCRRDRSQFGGLADLFRPSDGWLQAQFVGQGLFRRWCRMIGEEHWLADPRFQTDDDRGINGAVLSERTQRWMAELTTEKALAALEAARIPAGPPLAPAEVFKDEHVQATNVLPPME